MTEDVKFLVFVIGCCACFAIIFSGFLFVVLSFFNDKLFEEKELTKVEEEKDRIS